MGCTTSKAAGSPMMRMLEYERIAASENEGLKLLPNSLSSEEWREGLISPRTFFNWCHAGYCSAYVQNPSYMLIVDFRCLEDWLAERVVTSIQHDRLPDYEQGLHLFSMIVLYDRDGCSVGNIKSPLRKTYLRLRSAGLDPKIILGGLRSLRSAPYSALLIRPRSIPFASAVQPTAANSLESIADTDYSEEPEHELEIVQPVVGRVEPERRAIHWLPSMIIEKQLYLGRADQASDPYVIQTLGITHILSTSRIRFGKIKGLIYILVNKTSFSLSTIKLTNNFICEALAEGGRILVHGCDGLDQSAAVVTAALMQHYSASLEDCMWYVEHSRPGVGLSTPWLRILLRLEEEMFGRNITDAETLWT